jgi:hypothetical protein
MELASVRAARQARDRVNEIADDSLLPQLVKLVALMLNADAADGALLLTDEACPAD